MRSAAEHLAQVLALVIPPEPRLVPLGEALDAVCALDVRASGDLPPFDNSAMDGYALRTEDVAAATEGTLSSWTWSGKRPRDILGVAPSHGARRCAS